MIAPYISEQLERAAAANLPAVVFLVASTMRTYPGEGGEGLQQRVGEVELTPASRTSDAAVMAHECRIPTHGSWFMGYYIQTQKRRPEAQVRS